MLNVIGGNTSTDNRLSRGEEKCYEMLQERTRCARATKYGLTAFLLKKAISRTTTRVGNATNADRIYQRGVLSDPVQDFGVQLRGVGKHVDPFDSLI